MKQIGLICLSLSTFAWLTVDYIMKIHGDITFFCRNVMYLVTGTLHVLFNLAKRILVEVTDMHNLSICKMFAICCNVLKGKNTFVSKTTYISLSLHRQYILLSLSFYMFKQK